MKLIPAIDLYDNRCVRLNKGQFTEVTQYSDDPINCAQHFAAQGATELHVVDLNGAQSGAPKHLELIAQIKASTPLLIQTGGGLRTATAISDVLNRGIDRVVIGSIAVTQPDMINTLIKQFGVDRFVLAFDVMIATEPLIAIKGWLEQTDMSLWQLLTQYQKHDGLRILCTDINRDGMLVGPNLDLYQSCKERFANLQFQASGGVAELSDLVALKQVQVAAAIIGKALYENRFSLTDAQREIAVC